MKDSLHVSQLLNICVDRCSSLPQIYLQPIIEILKICSKPFWKEKSSDKLVYHKTYIDLISQLGWNCCFQMPVLICVQATLSDQTTQKSGYRYASLLLIYITLNRWKNCSKVCYFFSYFSTNQLVKLYLLIYNQFFITDC